MMREFIQICILLSPCLRSIMKIFFARKTDTLSNKVDPFTVAFDDSQRHMLKSFDGFQWFLLARVAPWPFGGKLKLTAEKFP